MAKKISDTQLVNDIAQNLTAYQDILVKRKISGRTEDQSIIPSVTLSYQEMRKKTHRRKIYTSFLVKIQGLFEDWGMEVEHVHNALIITKPADDLDTEFENSNDLARVVDEILQLEDEV